MSPGVFPNQGLNPCLLHWQVDSLPPSHQGSPKALRTSENPFQPAVNWVVPVADKMRFDEIFLKTDLDLDGYVSGQEVKEIFMHSGLTQNLLAHIW